MFTSEPSKESNLFKQGHYNNIKILKLFWQSEHRLIASLFVIAILALTLILVGFDVAFSYWANYFYNALQAYNKKSALFLLLVFFGMAAVYIIIAVYNYYISQVFGLRWRRFLTQQFINRWLDKRDYYYLELFDKRTDNPDQRIQEDISALVNLTISISTGIISAIATVLGFLIVLWQLSGSLTIPLGTLGKLEIPGYLVWVAIIYSFAGTYLTFIIGKPLIGLNFEQQSREASFRFAAIDLRSHAENVALYQGEQHQNNILQRLFNAVLENYYAIILRQKLLLWFTAGYNQIAVALPLLVVMPNYFNKVFMLGGLMQSIRAFASVQTSLSFLVNSYTTIAEWRAVMLRLTTFLNHLQEINASVRQHHHLTTEHKGDKLIINNVTLNTPDQKVLLSHISETFTPGQHYLIKGVSGIGKSTFIRALAGIWPYTSGEITYPQNKHIMFLPQKPYMPIGTLSEALLFPDKTHPEWGKKLENLLHLCHLEKFIPKLNEIAAWSEQLSPGEQQRVSLLRVLLHQPDWIFLDESTSMLDNENEHFFYHLLKDQLPNSTIISIGHNATLESFHDHVIDMMKYKSPAKMAMA